MAIDFYPRAQIDEIRWNKAVESSANPLVYAYSWYLDRVSPGWGALINDDYSAVFPLPINRKPGFLLLTQPFLAQQLGLFCPEKATDALLWRFIRAIPKTFLHVDINLNTANPLGEVPNALKQRVTYHLHLRGHYRQIAGAYSTNARRNVRKAEHAGISIDTSGSPSLFLELYRRYSTAPHFRAVHPLLSALIPELLQRDCIEPVTAFDRNGTPCASALWVKADGKLIYLASVATPEGRKHRAMFYLIDRIIRNYAQSNLTLDFEGSMVPSIASFFAGFGASPVYYGNYVRNSFGAAGKLAVALYRKLYSDKG